MKGYKGEIIISERRLKILMDWAFNEGKNDGWEHSYKRLRDEKVAKL